MFPFNIILVFTLFALQHALATPTARSSVNITRSFALSPPHSPHPEKQVHDADFHSFSIEFCYMVDYAGNDT